LVWDRERCGITGVDAVEEVVEVEERGLLVTVWERLRDWKYCDRWFGSGAAGNSEIGDMSGDVEGVHEPPEDCPVSESADDLREEDEEFAEAIEA
jgi:hypothetical protein